MEEVAAPVVAVGAEVLVAVEGVAAEAPEAAVVRAAVEALGAAPAAAQLGAGVRRRALPGEALREALEAVVERRAPTGAQEALE